jgi:DNA-binding transcriptional LysR family regulator
MVLSVPWNDRVRRRFKLRDLDILMEVVAAGSMGKAAARLNMAQPAVSKAVADLEHVLGVRLFDRSQQGVAPTAYGLALVKRGAAMFDELRQGFEDIDFLADPTAGELRLACTEAVATAIIAPLVERLTQRYPRMSFHVVTGGFEALSRDLPERKYEFVVSRVPDPLGDELQSETLFHDSLVIVAAAGNPLTRSREVTLGELVDRPWVLQLDTFFGPILAATFRAKGLEPPRTVVATMSHSMRTQLLATGRYLGIAPGFSIRLPRKHAVLRALPVDLSRAPNPVAIITLKKRSLSGIAQLFIENLRAFTRPLAKSRPPVPTETNKG